MAISEIYVDPSIAGDSGTGTIGDPYGDLEYAIEQTTFDTTNGTRINIKAGTDEVLAASLDNALADTVTTVAWVPSATAPCIFQGYTTTAGDGGIGGISGGGSVSIIGGALLDYINFIDLHLHNTGANRIIDLDNFCSVIRCELDNSTGAVGASLDFAAHVVNCYIHNMSQIGIEIESGAICNNFFENGTNDFSYCLSAKANALVSRNIIKVDGSTIGMLVDDNVVVKHNSIWSNGGTGKGIVATTGPNIVMNNIVEGFSGAGGVGIDLSGTDIVSAYGGNSVYNCTTNFNESTSIICNFGGNESLSATPFTSASTGDFSPIDTGSVKEGSVPSNWNN